MSKISTLYDLLVTRTQALLPDHLRLSDPYLFAKNTESEKRQGFGFRVLSGEHTRNNLSCDIILQQDFTLVLTRMVLARELDQPAKADTEKALLEDLFLIIKDVESSPNMDDPTTVVLSAYVSHGGIEFVEGDRDGWMRLEATFRFRYRQDLN